MCTTLFKHYDDDAKKQKPKKPKPVEKPVSKKVKIEPLLPHPAPISTLPLLPHPAPISTLTFFGVSFDKTNLRILHEIPEGTHLCELIEKASLEHVVNPLIDKVDLLVPVLDLPPVTNQYTGINIRLKGSETYTVMLNALEKTQPLFGKTFQDKDVFKYSVEAIVATNRPVKEENKATTFTATVITGMQTLIKCGYSSDCV